MGLQLNVQKTKVLTTQAQLPLRLHTPNGLIISVLDKESSHKCLGCMSTAPAQTTTCDVECRLQAAARVFNANKWILCDAKVAIAQRLEYFDRVISPIACFAAGHRAVYRNDLRSMDVGLLAIWTGHCHGMKFSTCGMSGFGAAPRRPCPNHAQIFVYDTTKMWHNISQHYLHIVGSKGLWLGIQKGINALAAQNITGIV